MKYEYCKNCDYTSVTSSVTQTKCFNNELYMLNEKSSRFSNKTYTIKVNKLVIAHCKLLNLRDLT